MKKGLAITLSVFLVIALSGCAKKKAVHEEATDAINLDTLETANVAQPATGVTSAAPATSIALDATTPQGTTSVLAETPAPSSSEPTMRNIQIALKNAGMYPGVVSGTGGVKTKAAVKDFQKANGLAADGKVGPKTWAKLSAYLNAATAAPAATASEPATAPAPEKTSKTRKTTKHTRRSVSEPPAAQ